MKRGFQMVEKNSVAGMFSVKGNIPQELVSLTEQQWSILYLLSCKCTAEEIGKEVGLSKTSAEKSCSYIMNLIHCNNVPELKDYLKRCEIVFEIDEAVQVKK